jgi:hypothetical protein
MSDPLGSRKGRVQYHSHRGREVLDESDIRGRLRAIQRAAPSPPVAPAADLADHLDDGFPGSPHDGPIAADSEPEDAPADGAVTDDEADDEAEGVPQPDRAGCSSPWDRVREQLHQSYLEQLVPNQLLHQQLCSAELQAYQQCNHVTHCRCTQCGNFTLHRAVLHTSQEHQPGGGGDEAAHTAQHLCYTVHLCTQLAIHELQVWPVQCSHCQYVHRIGALEFGCLPGTADGFTKQQRGVRFVWFSSDLLQHLDRAIFVEGDQSIYKYVETRQAGWLSNQQVMDLQLPDDSLLSAEAALPELPGSYKLQQLPVTADTLRRQLGDAVREYGRIRIVLETLPEQLPGYPHNPRVPCAACLPGEAHISFDMCFKLEQLKRKGFSLGGDDTADQRRFVSHAATIRTLAEIDGTMQQQHYLVPAAAAAVSQIPARVPDLCGASSAASEQGEEPRAGSAAGGGSESTAAAAAAPQAAGGGSSSSSARGAAGSGQEPPATDAPAPGAAATAAGADAAQGAAWACAGTCSRFTADTLAANAPKGVSRWSI